MHLWPTVRLRDSFKNAYLKKLELNLHLMKLDKKRKQQQQQDSRASTSNGNDCHEKLLNNVEEDPLTCGEKFISICREFLLILSCCYCCFCCGACIPDEEN